MDWRLHYMSGYRSSYIFHGKYLVCYGCIPCFHGGVFRSGIYGAAYRILRRFSYHACVFQACGQKTNKVWQRKRAAPLKCRQGDRKNCSGKKNNR